MFNEIMRTFALILGFVTLAMGFIALVVIGFYKLAKWGDKQKPWVQYLLMIGFYLVLFFIMATGMVLIEHHII